MKGDDQGRSVSSWRPVVSIEMLHARARLLTGIRAFFADRGVTEVDTPVCSRAATTDPAIESLRTCYTGPEAPEGLPLFLQTSPEFAMKRLLAAGSGPIYQICKVFRDGELGPRHNPEFSLLEWYRPGFDHHRLMDEVEALIGSLDPATPVAERFSYQQLFQHHLGIDPHRATLEELRDCALSQPLSGVEQLELPRHDAWLDLLLTHCIEPRLQGLCFVYDYPASQAALARVREGTPAVAERFELYIDGVEIANGFHELTDAETQEYRFRNDLQQRAAAGQAQVPMDRHLIDALASGLPACSGVALGVDRLLMRLTGALRIEEVLAFPLMRA